MSAVKEKVRVLIGSDVRYIEGMCESCPHFSGTSTCRILTDKVYLEDSVTDVETYRFLDRSRTVKRKSACQLFNNHAEVNIMDGTLDFQGGEENFKKTLWEWIKKNCRDGDLVTYQSSTLSSILDAIKLFKGGDVEKLAERYYATVFNAGNNPLYAKPFEYFTGVKLSIFSNAIGSKKSMKVILDYLKEMSKYRKILSRMVTVSKLYSRSQTDPENFEYNFRKFFTELLFGKDIEAYYRFNQVSQYTILEHHWGYNLQYREALKEVGGFTEEEVPVISYVLGNKSYDELSEKELNRLRKLHTQEKIAFIKFAQARFSEEVVSP